MSPRPIGRIVLLAIVVPALPVGAGAQPHDAHPASPKLFDEIAAMDSILFGAFNAGDIDRLRTLFTRDLEFYHDQSGLTSYEDNMEAFVALFSRDDGLRRELVPGSLRVYPVSGHGAIEVGEHTFCHGKGGQQDCGTFPFVHIWRKDAGTWKVSRVVSYGH